MKRVRYSIEKKVVMGVGIVILLLFAVSLFIYRMAVGLVRQTIYEKMASQTMYSLQSMDTELNHIRRLQIEYLNDRQLVFLVLPDMNITEYERREGLLSMRERMLTITGVSNFVEEGILYLPRSEYKITAYAVNHMSEEDQETVKKMISYADGGIHWDEEGFFSVETGAPRIQSAYLPNYMVVIRYDSEQLKKSLGLLNTTKNSGAFLYNWESEQLVESSQGDAQGRKILEKLLEDGEDHLPKTRRIGVEGRNYLVFVGGDGLLGMFVQYVQEDAVMILVNRFRNMVYVLLGSMFFVAFGFGAYIRQLIHKPVDILLKAFQRIREGNWKERIVHQQKDEFGYLYDGFNEMEEEMDKMIEQVYIQTNLAQRAQMKQLQAQIAPHFLYNSFFILSRRIKRGDYDQARELAGYLGTYFQYLARNESDIVTLKQEILHARSYAAIQGMRFANRIRIDFQELPQSMEGVQVPRLIIQPLLENVFKYGLENKIADGILRVRFQEYEDRLEIRVEDNGEEASDETICEIRESLAHGKQGEITGIYNIHRRLQIFCGKESGLQVSRSDLGGMCIMVLIKRGNGNEVKSFNSR